MHAEQSGMCAHDAVSAGFNMAKRNRNVAPTKPVEHHTGTGNTHSNAKRKRRRKSETYTEDAAKPTRQGPVLQDMRTEEC